MIGEVLNLTVVAGRLVRPCALRELNGGHRVLSLEVSPSGPEDRGSASVPVAWLDPPSAAETLDVGDEVVVVGRVHRRFFRAGGATQSRTEVSADLVVRARQRSRVRRALTEAASSLDDLIASPTG